MIIQNSKFKLVQEYSILAILFLLPAYLVKLKFGWATFNALEFLIVLLFIAWFFDKEKKYQIPARLASRLEAGGLNTRYEIPIVLMIAGLVLSAVVSKNYYVGLGAIKGWFAFPILFGIIFFDVSKKDESLMKKSLIVLFSSGVAVSAIGIVYKFMGIVTYDGRLKIFWDSPNQLAMFLAPALLIGIFFMEHGTWNMEQNIIKRKTRLFLVSAGQILITVNLYLTKSYGAWVAVAVVMAALIWLKNRGKKRKGYFIVMIIIITIFIAAAGLSEFEEIKKNGERSSLTSRVMIWKSAGLMIENNPLFGIGPGNFQRTYLDYQKYFPPYLEWAAPQPHNLYLAFWLEAGFAGLVGFIWLLILFFRDNKKSRRKNYGAALLCLSVILYFLVHGLVDTTYWRNDMAVVFWTAIAINLHLSKKENLFKEIGNKISN